MALPIEKKEIKDGLWALKAFRAPRSDGLHVGFYKRFWMITEKSVEEVVKEVFERGCVPFYLNKTLITLIPKHSGADSLRSFRPSAFATLFTKLFQR